MQNNANIVCSSCGDNYENILDEHNNGTKRVYNKDKHHLICKNCISKFVFYSKTKSKRLFLLKDDDFDGLKHLYISNINNNNHFYYNNIVI